jgi:DNA polymerase bacteriophage-type
MSVLMSTDLETISEAPLEKVQAAGYLNHASTRCIFVGYHVIGQLGRPQLWCEGDPVPYAIKGHIANGGLMTGWNCIQFDRIAWKLLLVPLGFPEVPDDNWRDSMHLAAAANLPRSLDGCAKAVGLQFENDLKDKQRIKRVTNAIKTPIPDKVRTILTEPERFDPRLVEDLRWLADRCVQDVELEEQNLARLPPWPDMHPWLAMPAIDRRINDRGVLIDVPLVQGMARAAALETSRLDGEMARLTGEAVARTSTVDQLKKWLVTRGVDVPRKDGRTAEDAEQLDLGDESDDGPESETEKGSPYRLRKNDIANLLAGDLPDDCRAALYMRIEAAKASARKLTKMLTVADGRGIIQNAFTLMGAQATGRFAHPGPQLGNMVRDAFAKDYEAIAEKNGLDPKKDKAAVKRLASQMLATAVEVGRTGDPDLIRTMYEAPRKDLQGRVRIEGVLPWISRMSRRTIAAPRGQVLLNGDFSNIQARIPVWLAGQQETVDAFARGEDLYRRQASLVYGLPPEQLSSEQRQIGKVMTLFLGFGAGVNAFIPAAMIYGISVPREQGIMFVNLFRDTNKPLVNFWDANLAAAVAAVQNPGQQFWVPPTGLISWFTYGDCLCCMLPSGRLLHYWRPRLSQGYWENGTPKRTLDLVVDFVKGPFVFRRALWRGICIQNLCCAIEADLLCGALVNMDRMDLPVRIHVHDSASATADEDRAEALLPRFKTAMLDQPSYYRGLPIAADVDISARFG